MRRVTDVQFARGAVASVAMVLTFATIWALATSSSEVAIMAMVLLVALCGIAVIWPDSLKVGPTGAAMSRDQQVKAAEERIGRASQRVLQLAAGDTLSVGSASYRVLESVDVAHREEVMKALQRLQPLQAQADRTAVEELITESAEWGWLMAQIGFQTPPRPAIAWDGEQPRILHGTGADDGVRGGRLTGLARAPMDTAE